MSTRLPRQDYRELWPWIGVIIFSAVCLLLRDRAPWLNQLPTDLVIPVSDWINSYMDWFIDTFKWLFRSMNWLLSWPMNGAQALLQWLPWPATIAVFCVVAYVSSGWRLSIFTGLALLYMVITGYWSPIMNTLGIVFVLIPLAIAVCFTLAVAAYQA